MIRYEIVQDFVAQMYFKTTNIKIGNLRKVVFFLFDIIESPVTLPKNKIKTNFVGHCYES